MAYELVIFDWDGTLMEMHDVLYVNALPVLQSLQSAGIKLAVATGKDRFGLDRVLAEKGYGVYFHTTRTSDQTRMKPDPLMLDEILIELNVDVSRALMVGDSVYDLAMAQRIGMDSVGITTGGCSFAMLNEYKPVGVIDDLSELLPIVLT